MKATKRQVAFLAITDQRLKQILFDNNPLVLVVVKMVLEKEHLAREEYAHDNAYISLWFLVVLLDGDVPKVEVREMPMHLFRRDLLGGLEETLKVAFVGKGIP